MNSLVGLRDRLEAAWSSDSALDGAWLPDRPSAGHCAVTALVVQDECGGEIMRQALYPTGSHYFNRLPSGVLADLTVDQFTVYTPKGAPEPRTREYLLSNDDTLRRYRLLRSRL